MKVKLISHTPEPEKAIAAAAKLCYSKKRVEDLRWAIEPAKAAEFVEMLMDIGHESPLEHISFTFGIEGVSRTFLAQITRHRIASYSVQSQRYVSLDNFEYVTPPAIMEDEEAVLIYEKAMADAAESYQKLSQILSDKHTKALIEAGEEPKEAARKAKKIAIEDARFVLPGACDTKMIVTMNARGLQNFFKHRCCNRAQWEIRAVADEMLRLVKEVAPTVFAKCGPPCIAAPCPEGKMSCGMIVQVREKYRGV